MNTESQLDMLYTTSKRSPFCISNFAFPSFWPFLTSTVHQFPDISGGHDLVGAQIVSDLATNGHDDGHDEVRKCRNYAHLDKRANSFLCNKCKTYGHWNKPRKQTFYCFDFALQCHVKVVLVQYTTHCPHLVSVTLLISNPNTSSKYAGWLMRSR